VVHDLIIQDMRRYSTFVNWELWWPQFPILVYFKETQTKPEGQVHFFPVIFVSSSIHPVKQVCFSIPRYSQPMLWHRMADSYTMQWWSVLDPRRRVALNSATDLPSYLVSPWPDSVSRRSLSLGTLSLLLRASATPAQRK